MTTRFRALAPAAAFHPAQALVDLHHFIEANPDLDVLNQMLSQVRGLKAKLSANGNRASA